MSKMIKTIFFDMDGTLYDETHAKIKAEMQTAEYAAHHNGLDFDTVYNAYIIAKWAVINSDGKNPNRNNSTKWYERMLSDLHIKKPSAEELSDKYWEVVKAILSHIVTLCSLCQNLRRNTSYTF